MTDAPPLLFDRAVHRARLDRAAGGYAGFLKQRVAEDAAERLAAVLRDFPLALDLGARDGALARALQHDPAANRIGTLIEADLSGAMLQRNPAALRVVADEERLPFAPESLDLIVSLLSLHWTNDLVGALVQIRRTLKPDGLFVGALFGGETLTELRQSLIAAEAELADGAGLRVSPFADGLDAAGLLQRAGFTLPVADVERLTVRYDHPLKLMADLRAMGETNALTDRARRPLTRPVLARASEIYRERFGLPDGRIPATFEVVAVTGWAPHASQPQPLKPGSAKVRLADALGVVEHRLARE
ncbi:MAG TPA: methyltransferase domain-containing protein [Caulobacteraceae bacterium]|jgi:SAM-dependent methyltransferase|nr:methyltransferase domain-containing protein [Caulobacteraceae bacterium]